jgi:ABC-type uncharacterized transport system substrate-binding protein
VRRREFITLLGSAAVAWPITARAQRRAKIPRIGIIDEAPMWSPFRQGLRDLGYVEGQNIAFDYRYANGVPERLAQAAAELVRVPVDVIATFGTPPTVAAMRSTTSIPIVMIGIGDPLRAGLAQSLAHPGANVTGNTNFGPALAAKRLQLFKEAVPAISRVALLWNPDNASSVFNFEELQVAAPALGMAFISVPMRSSDEFYRVFTAIMREHPDGLLITGDPVQQLHIGQIIDFLATNRLPAMFYVRENVVAGGLMSYGASLPELFRGGARYVHRILEGTKPTDLPVEQPTKFELVINVKTAKALGLAISESFLLRADELIE